MKLPAPIYFFMAVLCISAAYETYRVNRDTVPIPHRWLHRLLGWYLCGGLVVVAILMSAIGILKMMP